MAQTFMHLGLGAPNMLFLGGEKIPPLEVGKVQDKAGSDTQYDFEEKDL